MSRNDQQINLPSLSALRSHLAQPLKQVNRSLNAEVVTHRQSSFEADQFSLDGVVPIPASLLDRMAGVRELADLITDQSRLKGLEQMATATQVFNSFEREHSHKSPEFKAGFMVVLAKLIDGKPMGPAPYPARTAQADAYTAGQAEGRRVADKHFAVQS